MPNWLVSILGKIYTRIPSDIRPIVKKIFYWCLLRMQAVLSLKSIERGKRVEFLGFEIAYLEGHEFLGPGKHEVLVESQCSIVSPGTENAVLCGLPGARRAFPYVPGYSLAGRVTKTGKGVERFRVGDHVTGRVSHTSHDTVSTDLLFKIPEKVTFEAASFIELGIIVLQGIRKARIEPGDRVAVVGQGLIGQLCNRMLRLVGADEIIGIASSSSRRESAMIEGGCDQYISLRESGDDLSSVNADVVIEAVGSPDTVKTALTCCKRNGRVVLLGSSRGLTRNFNMHTLIQRRGITVVGAHISDMPEKDISPGRWTYKEEGRLFLSLLEQNLLSVTELITWKAHPNECNAVYETFAEGGKNQVAVMFDWRLL